MCRLTVHRIIPPLCNFHLSAVQTCFWYVKFQLHFERWQDFSEEERQDSCSSLARNGNSCLPSGTLCYRFRLLPGERPVLSTMWGRPTEEALLISSEVLHSPFWKTLGWSEPPTKCSSSPYNAEAYILLLQLDVYGENCSSPKVQIASEEDKMEGKMMMVRKETEAGKLMAAV